ncbi:MAG: adenylate/guanylate cyclase domain-containing protein [Desulfobacteraceae bacterium]|jgi:adenylate cyclase
MTAKHATANRLALSGMIFIMLLTPAAYRTDLVSRIESYAYDSLFLLRGPISIPDEIVIIAIDEPSFRVIGKQWPWPRNLHAGLIKSLFDNGAETVAVDIIFSDPSVPKADQDLTATIKNHPKLVLAGGLDQIDRGNYIHQMLVLPYKDFISERSLIGINVLPVDKDGFVRQALLNIDHFASFANLAATVQLADHLPDTTKHNVEDEDKGKININFYDQPGSIKTVSYYQALRPEQYLPKNFFRDKLVFIGFLLQNVPSVSEKQPDHYLVPYSRQNAKTMSGVEVHATIAANLLRNQTIRWVPNPYLIACALFIWGLLILSASRLKITGLCLIFVSMLLLTAGSAFILFRSYAIYLPVVLIVFPLLTGFTTHIGFQYFFLFRERRFIHKAFSAYISPVLVKSILQSPEKLKLRGEFVDATVLHLDIKGFTSLAEKLPAQELVQILNTYLGAFAEVVFKQHGMIDKFIGDGIMAVWGAPVTQPNHADLACGAALAMLEKLDELNSMQTSSHDIRIRIGINSGRMLAGNVGAEKFFNYTVHGDDVNMAVRLEEMNKTYETQILIGKNTVIRLNEPFVVREIDQVVLRGKQIPVVIYELMGKSFDHPEKADAIEDVL